jgi:heptosyltransferase-2
LDKPKKILIVQTAFLGDLILTTPLIRETKKIFPLSDLYVVALPQYSDVLKNNPYVCEIIEFDKRKSKLRELIKTAKKLKKLQIDLAISPHRSATTAALLKLSKVKRIIGFKGFFSFLYDDAVSVPEEGLTIEKNLKLLSIFSDKDFDIKTEIYPTSKDYEKAREWLLSFGINFNYPIVGLAPGSVWETKKWKKEYYAEVARNLKSEKYNVVFIGDKKEALLCEEIISLAQAEMPNLAGKTNLLESAALVSHFDLLICNDSGAMHIANAMSCDVFAFFGPTVKAFGFFPYRENDKVFEVNLKCRPCSSHGGKECPLKHHNCMKLIYPNIVLEEIYKKFSEFKESKAKRLIFP